ncbi:hypothetical protein [Frondihabitans peucedani]|uniref:Uncharacterized protein n=1 Tax=Frondihabitans peucedani TaxID=598626 RepID=A0ABP8E588_9MICO
MTSLYERNETVPRARVSHYPPRSPQPHLSAPAEIAPASAPSAALDVSYDEFIITASIAVLATAEEA